MRIVNVVRLHFLVKQTFVWMPLIIFAGAVALSLAIVALIPADGVILVGANQAPLWYFFAIGLLALHRTFPFSQALSITRRDFWLGTIGAGTLTSAALATLFLVGGLIENATDGWGKRGAFFFLDAFGAGSNSTAWLAYFTMALSSFVAGLAIATIHKRFGVLGLVLTLLALGVVAAAGVVAITRSESWGPLIEAITLAGPGVIAAWGLAATAAVAVGGYLLLRRTQP